MGYLSKTHTSPQTPPAASGDLRIGIKNTFIEVMPPVAVPVGNRALTMPSPELDVPVWEDVNTGASSSHDQQHPQQQTGTAMIQPRNVQNDLSPTSAYFEPTTGMPMQMVPMQMVPVSYMPSSQEGYPVLMNPDGHYVDPSAYSQQGDGNSMAYDFSTQGVYFFPVSPDQFVPMNQGQMPMMEAPTAKNDQKRTPKHDSNNVQIQQYNHGPVSPAYHGNGNTREKRPPGGKKQREPPSHLQNNNNFNEGPKAVLVDLSKLRPKASLQSSGRPWYKH